MPRLNKSHLKDSLPLIFLIFLMCHSPISAHTGATSEKSSTIETEIIPTNARLGDTISLKIRKIESEKSLPKVYFDKSKLPVFKLSSTDAVNRISYFRTLIPLSANTKIGPHPIEIFYNGKGKKINLIVNDKKYLIEDLTLTKEVAALKATRIEKELVGKALYVLSNEKLWGDKFVFPSNGRHSTSYGIKRRVNGIISPDYFHKGLDFAAKEGSNIIAPENGKVVLAGYESKGFVVNGNCIFLDHGHSVVSGYLHLSKILVKEGDFVKKGQIIGQVGATGIASGPHLHWGIYVFGMTVDPLVWTNMTIE